MSTVGGSGRLRDWKPGLVQWTVSSLTFGSGLPPTSAASVWVTVRSAQIGGGVVVWPLLLRERPAFSGAEVMTSDDSGGASPISGCASGVGGGAGSAC